MIIKIEGDIHHNSYGTKQDVVDILSKLPQISVIEFDPLFAHSEITRIYENIPGTASYDSNLV